jgi:hypothetical protein
MAMKVFLDANILFSASRPESLMSRFLDKVLTHAEGFTNTYAAEEARRNLELKEADCLEALAKLIKRLSIVTEMSDVRDSGLKEKDLPILGGAVAAQCSHLLTSAKKDFGKFFGKSVRGVVVVSAAMLAEDFEKRGWLKRK